MGSFVYCVWSMGACAPIDQTLRFRRGSVNCVRTFSWGAAAPQTPRDDGLNLARPWPLDVEMYKSIRLITIATNVVMPPANTTNAAVTAIAPLQYLRESIIHY